MLTVEESGGGPLIGRLRQYLAGRRLLLVLDKVEQSADSSWSDWHPLIDWHPLNVRS
jgi:hypothetical protein